MTALLEALRRIETERPARSSAPAVGPVEKAAAPSEVAPPQQAALPPVAAPATLRMPQREKPAAPSFGEPPLSARATVARDIEAAAVALVHRFRAPALIALVTCGDAAADAEIVEAIDGAIQVQGYATKLFGADDADLDAYGLPSLELLRSSRGYHIVHTTSAAALEQTPLLALADGVVMLVELHRTTIQAAESIVGALRREAVAVSGILLIA